MGKRKEPIRHAPIVERFAARLGELRASRGMTQLELARAAGIASSYTGRLERGQASPGLDLLERLATALAVTPHDLIPLADPPDAETMLKDRARVLLENMIRSADRETLLLIVPLLAKIGGGPSSGR